jgi:uncharacterized protein YjbI with pentapeptide repeats
MIDQSELKEMLEQHKIWLKNKRGERLTLREADLRGANLSEADLRGANLRGADLRGANLRGADLSWADLSEADLRGANLRGADLSWADLSEADLIYMQLNQYQVFVQRNKTRIGCEYHDNTDWIKWTPDDVKTMAHDAYDFWKQYKQIIVAAIESLEH